MQLRRGAVIDVEPDAELSERISADGVILIHQLLWHDAVLAGTKGDGGPVLVRSADEHRIFALQLQVAGVDVSRQVGTRQMAEVYRAVDIRKGSGDEVAFGFGHGVLRSFAGIALREDKLTRDSGGVQGS